MRTTMDNTMNNTISAVEDLEKLLGKTALRDQVAFERLYELTSPKLMGLAVQMLKRKEWAEDVIQEAFVKIWYNAGQYHHARGSVMAWMVGIVRYRAIDMMRSLKLRGEFDRYQVDDFQSLQEHSVSEPEEHGLEECLEDLQENQKKSIMMAFYDGYTHSELAKKLSVPLGTMKSWIRRSLDKLKDCLDEL